MQLEFFLEEPSAEAFLQAFLPLWFPNTHPRFHVFQGKRDLLAKLPARLRAYRQWLPEDRRIVVLLDEDRQDCRRLKTQLEQTAFSAGFSTKSAPGPLGVFEVLNRIAVEELEAWFLGDTAAVCREFPRVKPFDRKQPFRNPDQVAGGTWEALERLLQHAGYYGGGMSKTEVAGRLGRHLDVATNRSGSFRTFVNGLVALGAT